MAMVIKRFGVYLVNLDPTIGREIKNTRPCLVVSPDEMNGVIRTVIGAPMTTKGRPYPTRIPCTFQKKEGWIVLDQIRTLDKIRLVTYLGDISSGAQDKAIAALGKLFAR